MSIRDILTPKRIMWTLFGAIVGYGGFCQGGEYILSQLQWVNENWANGKLHWPGPATIVNLVLVVAGLSIIGYVNWPHRSSKDEGFLSRFLRSAEKIGASPSVASQRLMQLLDHVRYLRNTIFEAFIAGRLRNVPWVFYNLEITLPEKIRLVLPSSVHDEFVSIVRNAKRKSKGDPIITCEAAFDYLDHEIWSAFFLEVDKMDESQGKASPPSSPPAS